MLLLLLLAALAAVPPEGGWPPPPDKALVVKVYDGDTVTLDGGEKVRLRWVNTPELKPMETFGLEAKQLAVDWMLNQEAWLVPTAEDPRDGYGRIIAGLRVRRNGPNQPPSDLSLELVRAGFAHVFIIPPEDDQAHVATLLAAQAEAQAKKLGIWSTPAYQGGLHMTSFHANAAGDDNLNLNGEYMRICNVSIGPIDTTGWSLRDKSGTVFKLPTLVVPAGHTFAVHTGFGRLQDDPARQLSAYLESDVPIWNNDGDTATLLDPSGKAVDSRTHKGG